MGKKKQPNQKPASFTPAHHTGLTLREEITGKKQSKGGSNNAKSLLKLEHLQNLASWATAKASAPSLGALFGTRYAAFADALGVPPDPSFFSCQRCESVLQPGNNCTVRIEKNRAMVRRRRKKSNICTQNTVVYRCHFCSHQNLKRGTPKGYIKAMHRPKAKPPSELGTAESVLQKSASLGINSVDEVTSPAIVDGNLKRDTTKSHVKDIHLSKAEPPPSESETAKSLLQKSANMEITSVDEVASPAIVSGIPTIDSPATPLARTGATLSLLEGKRRKRKKSGSKKPAESESNSAAMNAENAASTSSKRRRKSWTSLKEIAESNERNNSQKIANLTIPFFI